MKVTLAFHLENHVPRVWRKTAEAPNPGCLKSSVMSPQPGMICTVVTSAAVGPLCFQQVQVLCTCPQCQTLLATGLLAKVLLYLIGQPTQLTFNALTVKRKMKDTRPKTTDKLRAAVKATWARIIKIKTKNGWKYFTLCVMKLI